MKKALVQNLAPCGQKKSLFPKAGRNPTRKWRGCIKCLNFECVNFELIHPSPPRNCKAALQVQKLNCPAQL